MRANKKRLLTEHFLILTTNNRHTLINTYILQYSGSIFELKANCFISSSFFASSSWGEFSTLLLTDGADGGGVETTEEISELSTLNAF